MLEEDDLPALFGKSKATAASRAARIAGLRVVLITYLYQSQNSSHTAKNQQI